MGDTPLDGATWRKSSYSGGQGGDCVEVALLADGTTAVRNSNNPDAGVLFLTPSGMSTFVAGVKAGDFDHLTT